MNISTEIRKERRNKTTWCTVAPSTGLMHITWEALPHCFKSLEKWLYRHRGKRHARRSP